MSPVVIPLAYMESIFSSVSGVTVTEQLKAENQLEWVGKMNNIRSRAVEIIDVELICVYEDKAADIMLKVVACARILRYDTGG